MGQYCGRFKIDMESEESQSILEDDEDTESKTLLFDGGDQLQDVSVKDFILKKVIGRGSFGKVMLVQQRNTNKFFAMKTLRKQNLQQKERFIFQTKQEKNILQSLDNPFIVKLFFAFQTKQKLYLVMEFVNGGELFFHLRRARKFSEDLVRFYCAEILEAIDYLHQKKILYRDLKSENILLDAEGHVKLTDFGLAKQLLNEKTYTFCGTPSYLAPELIQGVGYSQSADWWTYGSIMYEMLVGKPPFQNMDRNKLFKLILKKKISLDQDMSENCTAILQRLLDKEPSTRLGANGADEIRNHPFFAGINWQQVRDRQSVPPWAPVVRGPKDLQFIDPIFTREQVQDTAMTRTMPNQTFEGFTYINNGNNDNQKQL